MVSHELELRELSLEVSRNSKSKTFPVMHASINYQVGAFPVVRVTISSAAVFNGTNSGDDITELFEDSPEGSQGTLWLVVGKKGNTGERIPLFSGYVSGTGANLVTNILTVQSNISFQLVCRAAAMNANPGGAFTYFTADTGMDPQPYVYHIKGREADVIGGNALAKLEGLFISNPAESLIRLIDLLRTSTSDTTTGLLSSITALSSFYTGDIRFKLNIQASNVHQVLARFGEKISQQLIGAPTAMAVNSTLSELLLSTIPQTIGKTSANSVDVCQMIVRPLVSGWNPTAKIALEAGDVLGISDTTAYRLDQRVDFWYVQIGRGEIFQASPLAAVYAPGYGQNGNAVFLDMDELDKAITSTLGKDGKKRYLVGRGTILPWWLYEAVDRYADSESTKSKNGTSNNVSQSDEEASNDPAPPGDEDLIAAEAEEELENAAGNPSEATKKVKQALGDSSDSDTHTIEADESDEPAPVGDEDLIAQAAEDSMSPVTGGGTNIGKTRDVKQSKSSWLDLCKRLAILSFLENGCVVNGVALRLPLYTVFKLLPWLGDTISFSVPSPQQTTKENELYKISTTPRYGLLDSISMTFECSHKEIQVICGATLSQVHDEELHRTMSALNPIYEESEDKCYNRAAQDFANNL